MKNTHGERGVGKAGFSRQPSAVSREALISIRFESAGQFTVGAGSWLATGGGPFL